MIKKLLSILLVLSILLSLAACGGKEPEAPAEQVPSSSAAEPTAEPDEEPEEEAGDEPEEKEPEEDEYAEDPELEALREADRAAESSFERIHTSDPVTLSRIGQSVEISVPTESPLYTDFTQTSPYRVMMVHDLSTGSGRTTITLSEGDTLSEEDWNSKLESWAEDEDVAEIGGLIKEERNGFEIIGGWCVDEWAVNASGKEVESRYYVGTANVGPCVLIVEIEYSFGTNRGSVIDESIIGTIFDHVTVNN